MPKAAPKPKKHDVYQARLIFETDPAISVMAHQVTPSALKKLKLDRAFYEQGFDESLMLYVDSTTSPEKAKQVLREEFRRWVKVAEEYFDEV